MQKKQCPLCKKEAFYLVHHMHNMTDTFAIAQLKHDFAGWTEGKGLCLPCLERFRKYNPADFDIQITAN